MYTLKYKIKAKMARGGFIVVKVLVTGDADYIGSHGVKILAHTCYKTKFFSQAFVSFKNG